MQEFSKVTTESDDTGATASIANRITELNEEGRPFAKEGFGVIRNFYQSGRISARVSAIQGMFFVQYNGMHGGGGPMFSAEENAVYSRLMTPQVLIDGKPYRLFYRNTVHYPFGYKSECTIQGIKFSHELVLDRNVIFRRVRVIDNPQHRDIRGRLQQVTRLKPIGVSSVGVIDGTTADQFKWTPGENVIRACTHYKYSNGKSIDLLIEMGSSSCRDLAFPLNDRTPNPTFWAKTDGLQQERFFLDEKSTSEESVWYMVFEKTDDEDLSSARIDKVYADFFASRTDDARIRSGNLLTDACFSGALDQLPYWEVEKTGGFRASPTYWVWGWDAMVHASVLAICGRQAEVKRMIDFTRLTADPVKGVAFAYDNPFVYNNAEPKLDPASVKEGVDALYNTRCRWGWQMFFVCLVNSYMQITGDEETVKAAMPFCRRIIACVRASIPEGMLYSPGYGYYPDKPKSVFHTPDDYALINSAVYYQGLRAWNELTGEYGEELEPLKREFLRLFWDEREGYWSDCYDAAGKVQRPFYPSYGPIAVSRFAVELCPEKTPHIAAYMRDHFKMGDFISMFDINTEGYLADGNQYGAYVPTVCRYYWNMMNAAGITDALDEFDSNIAKHWSALTFPEGQTCDVMNPDPAVYCDDTGNKQFFCAKAWLTDSIELHSGLKVAKEGLYFHAMANGKPYRIENLHFRGKRLNVAISGKGAKASYKLNGIELRDGFIPWDKLAAENNLEVTVVEA